MYLTSRHRPRDQPRELSIEVSGVSGAQWWTARRRRYHSGMNEPLPEIVRDPAPSPADIARVRAGLMAFNDAAVGKKTEVIQVAWYVKDATGDIRGARDAGCVAARLDTYEFQARPFYERHGYEVYGTLEGYPADGRTYSMKKSL